MWYGLEYLLVDWLQSDHQRDELLQLYLAQAAAIDDIRGTLRRNLRATADANAVKVDSKRQRERVRERERVRVSESERERERDRERESERAR